jgi:hypothetical protein
MNMIPIRNRWPEQRPESNRETRPAAGLTAEDIARLGAKHDEIIMLLRLWHGYGWMAADQTLSHWMHHNSGPHTPRLEDFKQV